MLNGIKATTYIHLGIFEIMRNRIQARLSSLREEIHHIEEIALGKRECLLCSGVIRYYSFENVYSGGGSSVCVYVSVYYFFTEFCMLSNIPSRAFLVECLLSPL